jgi:transcription antitermination factor NusG
MDSHLSEVFPWFALRVWSHHEKSVAAQLEAKEFKVFLPLYSSRRRWADRWKTLCLPLFPGYVFCQFDASTRTRVLATSGLIEIVRFGSELARIKTSEIEAIQRIVDSPLLTIPYPRMAAGQRVTISGGPLNGLEGTLMEVRKGLRLVVSVEMLQRSVLVEIDREWVVPSEPVKHSGVRALRCSAHAS